MDASGPLAGPVQSIGVEAMAELWSLYGVGDVDVERILNGRVPLGAGAEEDGGLTVGGGVVVVRDVKSDGLLEGIRIADAR